MVWYGVVLWGFGWLWVVWVVVWWLGCGWGFIRARCEVAPCGQILPCKIDFAQTKTPTLHNLHKIGAYQSKLLLKSLIA